ncbi:hypothetical protein NODU109028_10845 [Nocardioides dubius]|uniref:hypothetical protein n=2 Tax=Nocardioides dubius TaxID=317019 RepID=UPI0039EBE421
MNDHFQDQLGAMLRTRADHLDPTPVTFDTVRSTAGRIRRRRAGVAGVVAAVTLVGVPTAVLSLAGSDPDTAPAPASLPTFVDSGNERLLPEDQLPVNRSRLGLPALEPGTLERGADTRVPWAQGGVLHLPDGEQLNLDAPTRMLLPYDEGWLLGEQVGDGEYATRIVDADGTTLAEPEISPEVGAASGNGRYVSYLEGDSLVMHDNTTGRSQVVASAEKELEPALVGVDDEGAVYFNVGSEPGMTNDGRVWRNGTTTDLSPGTEQRITVVSPLGYTVRIVKMSDFGGCYAVFDPEGTEQARTCTHNPKVFSPDGASVAMGPNYGDGAGDLNLAIAGEDWSHPAHEWVNYTDAGVQQPTFSSMVWEDDEHLLVSMVDFSQGMEKTTWYLVRVGLDGTTELAADPIAGDQDTGFEFAG